MFTIRKRHMEGMREALEHNQGQILADVQAMHPETSLYSEEELLKRYNNSFNEALAQGYDKLKARSIARASVLSIDTVPVHPDYAWLNALLDYLPNEPHQAVKTYQRVLETLDGKTEHQNQDPVELKLQASMYAGSYWITRYRLKNFSDDALMLFYGGWNQEKRSAETQFHYAFWETQNHFHVTKRFWPIHTRYRQADQTLAPEIPYLIRLGPGEVWEESLVFGLPIALRLPYSIANFGGCIPNKDNVKVAHTMTFSLGYCWEGDVDQALAKTDKTCKAPESSHVRKRFSLYTLDYAGALLHQKIVTQQCSDELLVAQRV